jgi:uncharacterized protein
MLAILSPAKDMKVLPALNSGAIQCTLPLFLHEAQFLVDEMKRLDEDVLTELLGVSDKLGKLNRHRFQLWDAKHTQQNALQAIFAFTGEAYRGLNATGLTDGDLQVAKGYLRILSGLYGVLRPFDLIQEYRLEMGSKQSFGETKNLYFYWSKTITKALNKAIAESPGEKILVNLASVEYSSVIHFDELSHPIVVPVFKQEKNGKLSQVVVYAKRARGLMTRFIIENRLQHAEELKAFNYDGYYFDNRNSTDKEWLFVR